MKEPCIACRHNEVPATQEPCFSCVSFTDTRVRSYTKFETPQSIGVDMAAPDADMTVISTISFNPYAPGKLENLVHNNKIWIPQDPGPFNVDGYESLADVLERAYGQASAGKGAERHGQGLSFDEQPMQQLIRLYGIGFALGQAAKKAQEAQRLPTVERQVAELLGAINYLAGAVIALERGGMEEDDRD